MKPPGQPRRRTRLHPRSPRRQAEAPERRALVERLIAERRLCEAKPIIRNALEYPETWARDLTERELRLLVDAFRACRTWDPVDGHEIKKRSRGGNYLDPDDVMVVCRPCHDLTEREVALCDTIGLLAHSWASVTPLHPPR